MTGKHLRVWEFTAFLFCTLILAFPGRADACSCLAYPADDTKAAEMAYPKADAVFSGQVQAIKSGLPGLTRFKQVTFEVHRAWKGVDDDLDVVVRTAADSAACGFPFRKGETYLVFAFRGGKDDQLSTNICTLSRAASRAEGLIEELDKLKAAESTVR